MLTPRLPLFATLLAVSALTLTLPARAQTGAAPAAGSAAAKTYAVNLSPKVKVGQKFNLKTDLLGGGDLNMAIPVPGSTTTQQQQQKVSVVVHFDADCEVLAVTAQGQPQKLNLTIKALTATQNGQALPGLPAVGDKLVAERTDKTTKTITINGQPAPPQLTQLLGGAIPIDADGTDDQSTMGTKDPVAIGGTWKPGPAALAELQQDMPSATALNGAMKLDNVTGSGDSQVFKVSGNFTIVGAQLPLGPGVGIPAKECTMQVSDTIPATAKGTLTSSVKSTMQLNGSLPTPGGSVSVSGTQSQSVTGTVTFQ